MNNEQPQKRKRRLTLNDCRIDWKHFEVIDEDGNTLIESISDEEILEWKQSECGYSAFDRVSTYNSSTYFSIDYDTAKFKQYCAENRWSEERVAEEGLQKMFNDGWLKSAAYVNWKLHYFCIESREIEAFLVGINEPATKVDILQFLVENAEYILAEDINELPLYEYLLSVYRTDMLLKQQEKNPETFLASAQPRENDNNSIRIFFEGLLKNDPAFKQYHQTHSFIDTCTELERRLGFPINCNSLRRNIDRKNKKRKSDKWTIKDTKI